TVPATVMPALLNGFSFSAFGSQPGSALHHLLGPDVPNDHILVLIQLHGGNDGLNTVIPLDVYGNYYTARANVAIPQDRVLRLDGTDKTGLHPAMTKLQTLFNTGKANIVQSVGYDKQNFSHFRSTDIWMTGDDSNNRSTREKRGWLGRYLEDVYPGYPYEYPNSDMPDPLAIQISDMPTVTVQGDVFSMGLSITDPMNVYSFVNPFNDYPLNSEDANRELQYLRIITDKTKVYSDIIRAAYSKGTNQGTYDDTSLAKQLAIVARLISGGLKTRVYTVTLGGFDTHKKQVNAGDTSTGGHADLLKSLSAGISSFQGDLEKQSLDDRVLGMTFSEFGRRIKSNASMGTDHGAAAPLILFGKHVKKGVLGTSPDIPADVQVVDNIPFQYDFRSIYATVLERWFCVDKTKISQLMLKDYQSLPIISGTPCGLDDDIDEVNEQADKMILKFWPNPYQQVATLQFSTPGGKTVVQQLNALGQLVRIHAQETYPAGTFNIDIYEDQLPTGMYFIRLQTGNLQKVIRVIKAK
ncbi:MAG TPA: DUF1501 domain-containing protein, partial [Flavihumibacter sp.]|nr:DUF1501 domain-containing protein [Flavihumibacter sp.]